MAHPHSDERFQTPDQVSRRADNADCQHRLCDKRSGFLYVLLNQDRTTESRQLVEKFVNTRTFRIVGEVQSVEEMSRAIREGKASIF